MSSDVQSAIAPEPTWQFSLAQYHAMIRSGILTDDDPVELLEGWLVLKMPKKPAHRVATRLLRAALEAIAPLGWYVDSQEPITTADSEPEPDVMVVCGDTRDYLERHPAPPDLAVVVEVADTILQRDRDLKKLTYARAGVVEYWIVNLPDRQIEVYTAPQNHAGGADYDRREIFVEGDRVPVCIGGIGLDRILVRDVLPPAS